MSLPIVKVKLSKSDNVANSPQFTALVCEGYSVVSQIVVQSEIEDSESLELWLIMAKQPGSVPKALEEGLTIEKVSPQAEAYAWVIVGGVILGVGVATLMGWVL